MNVAAIHCKAGKGRTGTVVACYMLYSGMFTKELESSPPSAARKALAKFSHERTKDKKGVTINSQKRYVYYFASVLGNGTGVPYVERTYKIVEIVMMTAPNFDIGGGCDPYFFITNNGKEVYNYRQVMGRPKHFKGEAQCPLTLKLPPSLPRNLFAHIVQLLFLFTSAQVRGDVKIVFWDWDAMPGSDDKMFWLHFNTAFVHETDQEGMYCAYFPGKEIDMKKADRKKCLPGFGVRVLLADPDKMEEIEAHGGTMHELWAKSKHFRKKQKNKINDKMHGARRKDSISSKRADSEIMDVARPL
eukprot:gene8566-1532_t